jgi:hypothetical protein
MKNKENDLGVKIFFAFCIEFIIFCLLYIKYWIK